MQGFSASGGSPFGCGPCRFMDKMAITKKSSINDVLRCHPETIKVFERYNMGCMGCMGATDESIENGAMMHDIDSSIIIKEINKLIKKEK